MDQDILELIKKHLPAQVGEALQSELKALAGLRESAVTQQARIDADAKRIQALAAETADLGARLQAHSSRSVEVARREASLLDRERKADLLAQEVKFSELRRADAYALVQQVFASPVYRRTLTGSGPCRWRARPPASTTRAPRGFVANAPVNTTEEVRHG